MAILGDCHHCFRVLKSDSTLVQWVCSMCHSGPHWLIHECKHCKLKTCKSCCNKIGPATSASLTPEYLDFLREQAACNVKRMKNDFGEGQLSARVNDGAFKDSQLSFEEDVSQMTLGDKGFRTAQALAHILPFSIYRCEEGEIISDELFREYIAAAMTLGYFSVNEIEEYFEDASMFKLVRKETASD